MQHISTKDQLAPKLLFYFISLFFIISLSFFFFPLSVYFHLIFSLILKEYGEMFCKTNLKYVLHLSQYIQKDLDKYLSCLLAPNSTFKIEVPPEIPILKCSSLDKGFVSMQWVACHSIKYTLVKTTRHIRVITKMHVTILIIFINYFSNWRKTQNTYLVESEYECEREGET